MQVVEQRVFGTAGFGTAGFLTTRFGAAGAVTRGFGLAVTVARFAGTGGTVAVAVIFGACSGTTPAPAGLAGAVVAFGA